MWKDIDKTTQSMAGQLVISFMQEINEGEGSKYQFGGGGSFVYSLLMEVAPGLALAGGGGKK